MEEKWVRCPGYENWYDVSDLGNVRSYHVGGGKLDRGNVQRVMTPQIRDYVAVVLSKGVGVSKLIRVHVLVAKAFIPNPKNFKVVHHKNNNKLDPRAVNLEWVSSGKNQEYAYRDGLKKRPIGISNGRCRLLEEDVNNIFKSNKTIYELSAIYNIDKSVVADIRSGKLWSKLTGKKYVPKNFTSLGNQDIIDILHSNMKQDDLAKIYKISQSRVSAIKTGRSCSGVTGVVFKGKREYIYHGIKTTKGIKNI